MNKQLKKMGILAIPAICMIIFFLGTANASNDKGKKTPSLYKKEYAAQPLYVFVMHNGRQYVFINTRRTSGAISKNTAKAGNEKSSTKKASPQIREISLKPQSSFTQVKMDVPAQTNGSSFKDTPREKGLFIEPWMMELESWIKRMTTNIIDKILRLWNKQ